MQGGVFGGINYGDEAALLNPAPSVRLTDAFDNPVVEGCAKGCGVAMVLLCFRGELEEPSLSPQDVTQDSSDICRCHDTVSARHVCVCMVVRVCVSVCMCVCVCVVFN